MSLLPLPKQDSPIVENGKWWPTKIFYQWLKSVQDSVAADTNVFTFEQFGAEGDGVTDDAPAIQAAIDAAQAVNGLILGSPGATYMHTEIIEVTDSVSIDFRGATLKFVNSTASAIGFLVTGAGAIATTSPSVSAAAGQRSVELTDETGFIVGRYMEFDIWRNSPELTNYKHITRINGASGNFITFDVALPYAWITGSVSGFFNTVAVVEMLEHVHISNVTFDLSACTGTLSKGFKHVDVANCSFRNMRFENHAANDVVSCWFIQGCGNLYEDIYAFNCGNATGFGSQTIDVSYLNLSNCTIRGHRGVRSGTFGSEVVKCSYCNFSDIISEFARGRALKVAGSLFCNFSNGQCLNEESTGPTGLSLANSTAECTFINFRIVGITLGGFGDGIWLSDQYNINNTFIGCNSSLNVRNVFVGTSDTGNLFIGLISNDPSNITNNGKARFIGLNGRTYTPITSTGVANGQNDNVGLPATELVFLQNPTGAFSITGFVAPPGNPPLDGLMIKVWNLTGQTLTLKHATGSSVGNRIHTITGGDLTPILYFEMMYEHTNQFWFIANIR